MVAEGIASGSNASEGPANTNASNGDAHANGEPDQARDANGDLFGAVADASKNSKTDDEPPHFTYGKNDADEQEEKAPEARANLRKHLAASLASKTWTLPTATPEVDPKGFGDPISKEFWRNVWVACAVHNVSSR